MAKQRKRQSAGERKGEWRVIGGDQFPPVWRPSRGGDRLEGTVLRVTQGRFGQIWRVRTTNGEIVVLPNHVTLLSRLEEAGVGPGWDLRITCTEPGSRTKGDYYDYRIEVREPRTEDRSA